MRNNLSILDNQVTITSKELCDIINMFRAEAEDNSIPVVSMIIAANLSGLYHTLSCYMVHL